MAARETALVEITPEVLLKAYACGIFPMAESAEDPALYWIEPERRGIMMLDSFHVPARLARTVRADRFTVVCNRDFDAVIDGCAAPQPGRPRTWINTRIRNLYRGLYLLGHCHSVEAYEGDTLVGGLYGVSLGCGVLRREHVPRRARCLEGRARAPGGASARRRLPAARHAVRHRSPEGLRRHRGVAAPVSQAPGSRDRGQLRTSRRSRPRVPISGARGAASVATGKIGE